MGQKIKLVVEFDLGPFEVDPAKVANETFKALDAFAPGQVRAWVDPSEDVDIYKVLDIHKRIPYWNQGNDSPTPSHYRCQECNQYWPCKTVSAIENK